MVVLKEHHEMCIKKGMFKNVVNKYKREIFRPLQNIILNTYFLAVSRIKGLRIACFGAAFNI